MLNPAIYEKYGRRLSGQEMDELLFLLRKDGTLVYSGGSFNDAEVVTPSDSTSLANTTLGLYIGGAGDVSVVLESGSTVTFSGLLVGTIYPFRVTRVNATGTTATNIVALY